MVGDGFDREWLGENLQRRELLGTLRGEALSQAYASMDVFVFPSQTDTFGNVILEAMASGVPPIVTSGGGPKYMIRHGDTGFVAGGAQEFADRVIDLSNDPERRRRMGQAARDYAARCSWESVFEGVYQRYIDALGPEFCTAQSPSGQKYQTNPR